MEKLNERHGGSPLPMASSGVHGEALRFLLVGGSAALVDLLLYLLLTFAGVPTPIAKALSFAVASAAAYLGNKHFTYRREVKGAASVIVYAILYAVTLGLNVVVNDLIIAALRIPNAYEIGIAWTLATAASATINFIGTKFLIFRGDRLG